MRFSSFTSVFVAVVTATAATTTAHSHINSDVASLSLGGEDGRHHGATSSGLRGLLQTTNQHSRILKEDNDKDKDKNNKDKDEDVSTTPPAPEADNDNDNGDGANDASETSSSTTAAAETETTTESATDGDKGTPIDENDQQQLPPPSATDNVAANDNTADTAATTPSSNAASEGDSSSTSNVADPASDATPAADSSGSTAANDTTGGENATGGTVAESTTTDEFHDTSESLAVEFEEEFDLGTPVYWKFVDGAMVTSVDEAEKTLTEGTWLVGEIKEYNSTTGRYTITWEDNTSSKIGIRANYEIIKAMVQNGKLIQHADAFKPHMGENEAIYQPWKVGTPVYWEFAKLNGDGSISATTVAWYHGQITNFDYGHATYTITWEDGSTNNYGPDQFQLVNDMVAQAAPDSQATSSVPTDAGDDAGDTAVDTNDGEDGDDTDSSVSAGDSTSIREIDANGDYVPWQKGTAVFGEFDDGWYEGNIVHYTEEEEYGIEWEDGSVEYFGDHSLVDKWVIEYAKHIYQGHVGNDDEDEVVDPYVIGTFVYKSFREGEDEDGNGVVDSDELDRVWYTGRVTHFDMASGFYTITWEDDTISKYNDYDWMTRLVYNAKIQKTLETYDPYEEGTAVYWYWRNDAGEKIGYFGHVIDFDYNTGTYVLEFEDTDGSTFTDTYRGMHEWETVDDMVDYAKKHAEDALQQYPIGTPVYKRFEDGAYFGVVSGYDDGLYTISFTDGTAYDYPAGNDLDRMVHAAKVNEGDRRRHKSGLVGFGKTVLSFFILAIAFYATYVAYTRISTRKEETQPKNRPKLFSFPEDAVGDKNLQTEYRDDPIEDFTSTSGSIA